MMTKDIDPAEIGKQARYIQMAQEEIYELDVLVCGRCHNAFHFMEDFQEHKELNICEKDSTIRKCNESKAQVWAFLLWKATQIAANSEFAGSHNSWKLYQTWIKLEPSLRETWIVAGTTIQSFNKLGSGTLQEMPVKITKTVVDSPKNDKPILPVVKPQVAIAPKVAEIKKEPIRPIQPAPPLVPISQRVNMTTSTPLPSKPNRRAKRTDPNSNTVKDEVVEKIVAKRFNPRKKCYEYLVKWECFSHDTGNTWEIHEHLEKVPQILEIFEKQLARQKEQRALQQQAKEGLEKKPPTPIVKKEEPQTDLVALAAGLAGVKRKLNDSDYDEPSMADEDVEEDLPQHTLKKFKNGNSISIKVETKVDPAKKLIPIAPKTIQNGPKVDGADVIVIKDGNKTGIVKKSGPATAQTPAKGEAQLRLLQKTEITTKSGIVRIDANQVFLKKQHMQVQKTAPTPTQPVRRSIGNVQITQVNRNSPVQKQSPQQQVHQPIQKKLTPTNQVTRTVQRTSMSPTVPAAPIQKTAHKIAQRMAQKQAQPQQQPTPEQKILQLSKSGDLRVTKKTGTTPPAARKTMPPSNVRIQKVQQVQPASPSIDSESSNGGLTICPTTGNLIHEGEEEAIEEEVSNNDLEQQMLQAAAQAAEQEQEEQEQTQTLDLNSLEQPMVNEDGSPILVSGEDGTIYQVAGKNAEGQTILIAQGADGEQQFAYVASDEIESQVAAAVGAAGMTLENNQEEELTQEQIDSGEYQEVYQSEETDGTGVDQPLMIETGNSDEGNIPAEVVRAEAPSPGGTRKVVLLLQDGTFVVTEMHDDEYQALNIAN